MTTPNDMPKPSRLLPAATAGLLALLLALSLQAWHGFYTSDLGADPDEPAHAVTSLMVRDYLATAVGQNPLRFAEDYYARYPKVALGHYPPFYYLVAGVWLLPFRSWAALGVLQALQVGLLTATTAALMRNRLPMMAAALLAIGWSLQPYLQKLSLMIMSDLQVALLCLWSALAWQRFMHTRQLRWSLTFGFLAAAAILTKGSAWSLALLPGLCVLLTGDWKLLANSRTWAAVVPVALFALPWQLWSSRITQRGMTGMTPMQHLQEAVPFYAETLPRVLGLPLAALLLGALAVRIMGMMKGRWMDSLNAVLWSLLLATLAVVLLIPAGFTSRYLMPLLFPALALGVFEGLAFTHWLSGRFKVSAAALQFVGLLAMIILTFAGQPAAFEKHVTGFDQAFQSVAAQSAEDLDLRLLAISDARGEGSLVAAAAFDSPLTARKVSMLRGSKELSDQDWMGRGFKLRVQSPDEVLQLLKQRQVDWVLLDTALTEDPPASVRALVDQALNQATSGWSLRLESPVCKSREISGQLRLYQRATNDAVVSPATPSTPLPPPSF